MAGRLEGKVALITGGTSGIGEATVELFVAEGAINCHDLVVDGGMIAGGRTSYETTAPGAPV